MIHVDSLVHAYGDPAPRVLDDVTLSLPPGRVTALVGANGAGKSTLLSAIGRLISPRCGQVLLDGADITTTSPTAIAKRLAILRQDNRIAARLTVIDLVRFGRFPYCQGRLRAQDHAVVEQCLDYVEMAALRDRFLDELSGGQRQRALIAMVLAQETDYVLLDEPLNNLDMRHAASIMGLLRRAADDLGRTVVLVLHDINVASAYCDRIVAMRDGRIVVDGTPEEVMRSEVLEDVFGMPIPVHRVGDQLLALHWSPTVPCDPASADEPMERLADADQPKVFA